jgi:hypothetical protein
MRAYKFLQPGAVGRFSGFRWPQPDGDAAGRWVHASARIASCRRGVHACRIDDLPWWLGPELWEIELAGAVGAYAHKVAAPRGRLLRRVEGWTSAAQRDYAEACAWRTRDRGVEALSGASADRLAACASLEDMQVTARALADAAPTARIALTMAADGALAALSELPAMGAYVAAHAARHAAGAAAMAAERRWQAAWLAERLGLSGSPD